MGKHENNRVEVAAEKLLKELRLQIRKVGEFFIGFPTKCIEKRKKIPMNWWGIWITYILLGLFLLLSFKQARW